MTQEQEQAPGTRAMMALAERFPELRRECYGLTGRMCPGSGQVVEVTNPASSAGPGTRRREAKAQGKCMECGSAHTLSKAGKIARHDIWDHLQCCGRRRWTLRPEVEWLGLLVPIRQQHIGPVTIVDIRWVFDPHPAAALAEAIEAALEAKERRHE